MDSQANMILEHLQGGHDITALEALQMYGCFRLAARIADLRGRGIPIYTYIDEVPTAHGTTARIARYSLKQEITT